jgi:hypothetical protein
MALNKDNPEIKVLGNDKSIADGDSSPSSSDGTDFGSATVGGAPVQRTFTVKNEGGSTLTTSGLTLPSGFSLVEGLSGSIAAGKSDTFTVRMDTSSAGTKSGDIKFNTNDSNEAKYNFEIEGTVKAAATPPEIKVLGNDKSIADGDSSPSSSDGTDFGSATVGGLAVQRTFTVKNEGGSTLTTSGLTLPSGFSLVEGLSGSIAAGKSDTFTVRMDTTSAGTKSGDIKFNTNDSNEAKYNFEIEGTVKAAATPPEIKVLGNDKSIADGDSSPSSSDGTDFGSATVGGLAVQRTFTVKNEGGSTLTTSGLTLPSGFSLVEGLSASIAAGGSDTFTVRMDTTSAGTKSGDIKFNTNDSNEAKYNFEIEGTVKAAATPPEIKVLGNDKSIADGDSRPRNSDGTSFGTATVGGPAVQHTFTVKNEGGSTLTTSGLTLPSGFSLVEGLSASIAAGKSDTFTVRMDTTGAGTKSGDIKFNTNDSNEAKYNFEIEGTVKAAATSPEIVVLGDDKSIADGDSSPSSSDGTDFGSATVGGAPVQHTFTVKNEGGSTLTTSGLTLPSGFSLVEGLSASIAAGKSDTFTVRMDTTSAGTKSGDIKFNTNDSNEAKYNFEIEGTVKAAATPPEVVVLGNDKSIADGDSSSSSSDGTDFGSATVGGAPVQRTFTVKNEGGSTLTTSGLTLPSGFSLVEGLSASIAAGKSDTFTVRMDTASAGTKSGDIKFNTNDSNESKYNFEIEGTVKAAATPPEVVVLGNDKSIADGDSSASSSDGTSFGSATVGGLAVQHTFTVKNEGGSTLTTSGLTLPSGFSLVEGLSASIAAGKSDTFTVRMDTASAGTKSGDISFNTNDSNESHFNFSISGIVDGSSPGSKPEVRQSLLPKLDADGVADWETVTGNRESLYDIQYVVLHTTWLNPIGGNTSGGTAQSNIDYWKGANDSQSSAHYIIDEGTVYQTVADNDIAYHAGQNSYNQHSIGIEIVATASVAGTISDAEFTALAELVRWLCDAYEIPISHPSGFDNSSDSDMLPAGIIGHDQISLSGKTDPGLYFDWNAFIGLVASESLLI